jgi:hypothetical protein
MYAIVLIKFFFFMVIKQYSFIAYKEEKNMIEKKINNFW